MFSGHILQKPQLWQCYEENKEAVYQYEQSLEIC